MLAAFACGEGNPADDDATTTTTNPGTSDDPTSTEGSSTDASTDTSTDTSTGSDSTTSDFIPVPDVQGEDCDSFAQDCPEGEKCVPYSRDGDASWNGNKCVPISGTGEPGDECIWDGIVEATDNCGADSICWDTMEVDGVLVGVCTELCGGTLDVPVCPEGSTCLLNAEGTINLCIPHCDPLLQDCDEGEGCYPELDFFECVFTGDNFPAGDPCTVVNDCAPGNVCVGATYLPSCDGSSCCTSWCDLGDPNCDAFPGTECVPWYEEGTAPPGYENVGVCILLG